MSNFNVGDRVFHNRTRRRYRIVHIQGDRPGIPSGERTIWLELLGRDYERADLLALPETLAEQYLDEIEPRDLTGGDEATPHEDNPVT